ncbi:MAG: hypothetical protein J0I33_13815 [Microbacterium ginsengisoli]|uniref:hypothetical protein n=1 Tax=Microbacterium TaxID=33882 RepID=UPI0006F67393|nr:MULTISPECIES: hypothetical protein [unclassified Microbacterium]KQR90996.1 hypothetical protein ASF93_08755 [Microbacterium sp. Leaf347]KQS00006.1 hypothetical protein ASG00_10965 [Microbacterium sp. Leaf351]MBN9199707.1 hypothetical protein [Microbacterium ginsengisoli]OJU75235.1 MAG: hypothetical protein BGO15_04200 [Microbacterium sp. 71-23]
MSILSAAFSEWRECRAEYELLLNAAYERAAEATNDRLLNERGRRKGVTSISLFMGPLVRASAYASEELLEHWERHPRVTYEAFERQWMRDREAERWAA